MTLANQNFIIFSSIDWSTHWQLHHQLTTSLTSSGNKVLFIENTGIRSANIGDFKRIISRISSWNKGLHGFSSINNGKLTVFSPILLPFPYSKFALFFNNKIFSLLVSRWIKASKFRNPIVISFLPTPLIQNIINNIDPVLTIYYCANNMTESSKSASNVRPYEEYFFGNVDIVFTAASIIQENAKKYSEKSFYFPPGIDFDKFNLAIKSNKGIPNDLKKCKAPIIGYIGTLGKVIDQDLLCALADQCKDFTIVLIGPEYTNIDLLKSKSNIVLLGAKSHNQLPYYIKWFDVGIVPYLCNDFTEGVYPSKLNEYLAMGVPAVSTNLREVRESKETYGETVIIANNTEQFIKSTKFLASEKNNYSHKRKIINIAKLNSWESRFNRISKIIEKELIIKKDQRKEVNWKNKFNDYFYIQKKRIKISLVIIFSFLIIMYTPFFWFIGEQLVVKDTPEKSDAIVVFSGDGQSSYQNLSYQERALDATKFYKDGYSDKIFLSSGREQTIADVKIIKLYLINEGVPESSIYILNEYPNSTYQNVMMVKQALNKNNISSILFITSPYHSLRSTLIWRKNAPNIKTITPSIRSGSSKEVQWQGISMNKAKVIIYEYAAIIYNWFVERI